MYHCFELTTLVRKLHHSETPCLHCGNGFSANQLILRHQELRVSRYGLSSLAQRQSAKATTGNATYAGAFAAIMANVVLIGYVIVAFNDDKSEREADEAEKKKSR